MVRQDECSCEVSDSISFLGRRDQATLNMRAKVLLPHSALEYMKRQRGLYEGVKVLFSCDNLPNRASYWLAESKFWPSPVSP